MTRDGAGNCRSQRDQVVEILGRLLAEAWLRDHHQRPVEEPTANRTGSEVPRGDDSEAD